MLRRTRGWTMPEGGISVARPHRWGNPYKIGQEVVVVRREPLGVVERLDQAGAVEMLRRDLAAGSLDFTVEDVRRELAGHSLGCYCQEGTPCHGDLLLLVAAGADPASIEVPRLA